MPRDAVRDVVRGLTALEMTFVNYSKLPWTAHSPYIGQITYADTIFPCFAFLSGMSPVPLQRSVGLVGIGLGLQTISSFANGKLVRIPGVLQRLGLASIVANEPYLSLLQRFDGLVLVVLWSAVTFLGSNGPNPLAHPDFPSADASNTAQTRIDRFLFGQRIYAPTCDPEGLLGALTTAVSMLIGRAFVRRKISTSEMAMESISMIAAGESLHYLFPKYAPISKSLWTPSFVLVTSGISILKYLAVETLLPYFPAAVQTVLEAVGKRSLEVYVLSTLLTMMLNYGGTQSLSSGGKRLLGKLIGDSWSDFVLSLSLTGIVATSAKTMVSQQIRLRY